MSQRSITNLQEYLDLLEARNPYEAGRHLYKNISCGPHTTFLLEKKPAFARYARLAIGLRERKLQVVVREEGLGEADIADAVDLQILGFRPDGQRWSGTAKTLKGYRQQLKTFLAGSPTTEGHRRFTLFDLDPSGNPSPRFIWISVSQYVETELEEIYYTDERAFGALDKCVGVRWGSIVEGSSAEVGPRTLMFPFPVETWDKLIQEINEEATDEWREANGE